MNKKIIGIVCFLIVCAGIAISYSDTDFDELLNRIIQLEQNDNYQDERLQAIEEKIGITPPCIESWRCTDWSVCSPSILCYQETANITATCGGLATGGYCVNCNGNDNAGWDQIYDVSRIYDGDWNTYSTSWGIPWPSYPANASININYSKPLNALSTSLWQVKDGIIKNLTVPLNCWNLEPLQFKIVNEFWFYGNWRTYWMCYDGISWNVLNMSGGNGTENQYHVFPYEESMWWNIKISDVKGRQTRTCADLNNCGTTNNKPIEAQECIVDLCKDIVCIDSTKLCPDGFTAKCENTCSNGICSQCVPSCIGHESNRSIVIFQMDDLQAWWLEDKSAIVVNGLISRQIPVTLGVIPYDFSERDGVKGGIVENLKNWTKNYGNVVEAAVHTYNHNDYSGWSLQQQTDDIKKGKAEFDKRGIPIWSFVPAYNWGNANTPQAIVNAGLLIGIDGLENPYIDSSKNPMILEDGAWYGDDFSKWDFAIVSKLIDSNVKERGYYIIGFHQQDLQTNSQRTAFYLFLNKIKSSGKYRFMTAKQYYDYKKEVD